MHTITISVDGAASVERLAAIIRDFAADQALTYSRSELDFFLRAPAPAKVVVLPVRARSNPHAPAALGDGFIDEYGRLES